MQNTRYALHGLTKRLLRQNASILFIGLLLLQAVHPDAGTNTSSAELIVPEEDALGLAAYLNLFARIFVEGSLADVDQWTAELEALVNVRPLWEIFFTLMCHPVPQVSTKVLG